MSLVKTFLELETYDVKMKDAIEAKADVKLDEKEYQQMAFSYASVRVSGDNLNCGPFSYLAIPKLELSYKLKKTKNKRYRFLCIVHFSFLIKSM